MANGRTQEEITAFIDVFLARLRGQGMDILNVGGVLYEYKDGAWEAIETAGRERYEGLLYAAAQDEPFDYSTKHQAMWRSIMSSVVVNPEDVIFDKEPYLVCTNGTVNLYTKEVMSWSKEHFARRRTSVAYDPKAKCPEWEALTHRIFEDKDSTEAEELRLFLQEWMGLALVGGKRFHRDMRRGLIIEGPSRSGKSTITAIMRELFGKKYVATPTMEQLGTQFGKEALLNAMAVMRDDGVAEHMKGDSSVLKAIVTGEEIQIDRKFKTPVMFVFDGPVLFTTNILPKVSDESNAIYNRFALVRMTRVFDEKDSEAHFGAGVSALDYLVSKGELPGILNWCLDGFARVKRRGRLATPEAVREAGTYFRRQNDPAFDFALTCLKRDKRVTNASPGLVTAMCSFAESQHHTRIPAKKAARLVDRTIREVYQELRRETGDSDGGGLSVYPGIRLTEQGMIYLSVAREKGEGKGVDMATVNAKAL